MFLSDSSVRRPVAMSCLIIALIFLGVGSYGGLGLEYMPRVEVPYITVTTTYPGAGPAEIETDVAKKIEDAVGSLDGVKHITSTVVENACVTAIELNLDMDVDVAAVDVREKIDLVLDDLPEGADTPSIAKLDINAKPIATLALTGEAPLSELYDYADNSLRNRLSTIPGVGQVSLVGGAKKEVRVALDRDLVVTHGLTSTDVVKAVQNGVQTMPAGWVRHHGSEYTVKYDAEYRRVSDLGGLEIANHKGSRIYLNDLGTVSMATETPRQAAFVDGRPAIAIQVVKKGKANAAAVVEQIKAQVERLGRELPGGMELVWVTDDGAFIQASADSAMQSVWMGVLLTGVILLLFLHNLRLTLIVGLTMPVTFAISAFFVSLMGYTLNMSTLLAVGLSVGVLVTNSIVVLERIVRRFAESGNAREASRLGTSDVALAVLASAGTNLVVLLPITVMGSMVGRFLGPFAMTMIIVTAVSLFVSFTLTPILASVLLKPQKQGRRSLSGFMEKLQEKTMGSLAKVYSHFLDFFGGHGWAAALLMLAVVGLLFLSLNGPARSLGFTLVNDSDQGEILIKLEYPTHYDLARSVERVAKVDQALADLPHLLHRVTTVGKVTGAAGMNSEGVHLAQVTLRFSDRTERTETLDQLMAMVQERLSDQTDTLITVSYPSAVGGQSAPVDLEVYGSDLNTLDGLAKKIENLSEGLATVTEPDSSVRPGKPELRIIPKRAVLSDLGLPAASVGYMLRANLDGIEAGAFKRGDRTYNIRVMFAEEMGKDQIADYLLPGDGGRPLLLAGLAEVEEDRSPIQIIRNDRQRVAKVYAYLKGRTPLGTAVSDIDRAIRDKVELPPGYGYRFTGQYEVLEESNAQFGRALLLALVLTYLVLAAIMESFLQPVIVLVTIPLALIGMIWALYLAGESFSIFALVGAVMLIGIVVNNAILIAEQRKHFLAQGMPPRDAVVAAAVDQLRPIIMITLAAILGMLPLALGQGLGGEARVGIGVGSIGGIAASALLTMIVVPVLYQVFSKKKK